MANTFENPEPKDIQDRFYAQVENQRNRTEVIRKLKNLAEPSRDSTTPLRIAEWNQSDGDFFPGDTTAHPLPDSEE